LSPDSFLREPKTFLSDVKNTMSSTYKEADSDFDTAKEKIVDPAKQSEQQSVSQVNQSPFNNPSSQINIYVGAEKHPLPKKPLPKKPLPKKPLTKEKLEEIALKNQETSEKRKQSILASQSKQVKHIGDITFETIAIIGGILAVLGISISKK